MPARRLSSTSSSSLTSSPLPIDAAVLLDDNSTLGSPRDRPPPSAAPPARAPAAPLGGTSSPTSSSPHRIGDTAADDVEMQPIKGQHRRRKSSLMNAAGHHGSGAPSRPGAQPGVNHLSLAEEAESSHTDPWLRVDGSRAKDDVSGDSFSDEDLQDDEEMGLTGQDRSRKQKKKRRNTRLDQRVARDSEFSNGDQKDADKSVIRQLAINGGLILLWYTFSLSISLYNKWMFDQDRLNFAFPLFTTSLHMVVQFGLSGLVLYFVPSLRPHAPHSDAGRSRHESEPSRIGMSKMFYLTRIGPCGAATGLDIGLGNTSLKFISLTFYTMCKSSSLAFVLIFAFFFRLETPTWRLVAIIATMTLGVILMVFGEVKFELSGFILVISAAFFSGFRWSLTQILLLRNPATSNPFASIFFLSPVMFATLLILAIPVEGFGPLFEGLKALSAEWGTFTTPIFLIFPGCIAFLMTASEFALLQRTSVVTLSIAGIFKEVVTISAASLVFQDTLTLVNFVGLLTTMAAIAAYNYIKISKMRQEAQKSAYERHNGDNTSPSSRTVSDADNDDSAEETAGLLHQSIDMHESLVLSGGNSPLNREPSPTHSSDQHREHKLGHGD